MGLTLTRLWQLGIKHVNGHKMLFLLFKIFFQNEKLAQTHVPFQPYRLTIFHPKSDGITNTRE